MKNILRLIALFFIVSAIIQLSGIVSRTFDALWQWYKFYGYDNSGNVMLNTQTVLITFIISVLLIIFGFFIKEKTKEILVKNSIIYSYHSLSIGVLLLALLVLSPLSEFVAN